MTLQNPPTLSHSSAPDAEYNISACTKLLSFLHLFGQPFSLSFTRQGIALHSVSMQVSVGVGTLAGSTIMLLTIAWGGSLLVGRCDLNERVGALPPSILPCHQPVLHALCCILLPCSLQCNWQSY